ncbi:MAG: ABC transporter ATP-binding protein [Cellulosilyticaceae bacterium]
MTLLQVNQVFKTYTTHFKGAQVEALKDVSFSVEKGEYVAIMGESGSGKTTLLNLLATLDKPTEGDILLEGNAFSSIKESKKCKFRRDHLGFVFQDFNLLDTFSLKDNIVLPLVLQGVAYTEIEARLTPLAKKLGIAQVLAQFPYEVSGGQKQRAAVARALITQPKVVLADEPTGALDSKATQKLLGLFKQINEEGQTIVMVTHSTKAASYASRILFIKDGRLFNQIYRGNQDQETLHQQITDTLRVMQSEVE